MRRRLLMSAALVGMVASGCTGTGTDTADVAVDSQSSSTTVITATEAASSTTTTEASTTTTVGVAEALDDEWPVTIDLDLGTESFTAEGSDIDDGLFCSGGSVILIFEDASPTTAYWDIELKCEDGSGSFAVSAETFFEPDEDGELMVQDPVTGAFSMVENGGWWIVEDAIGDYAGITNVRSIGYQEISVTDFGLHQTMYGRLKRDS